jgi:hypothetical protein
MLRSAHPRDGRTGKRIVVQTVSWRVSPFSSCGKCQGVSPTYNDYVASL